MAEPTQRTVPYQAPLPSGDPPERVRVALVAGSGSAATDDLYRLLRRRLLILFSIIVGSNFVQLVIRVGRRLADPSSDDILKSWDIVAWVEYLWVGLVFLAIPGIGAVVLWRRPPRTVWGLRWVEVGVLAPLTVMVLNANFDPVFWGYLERAPGETPDIRAACVGWYAAGSCLLWFFNITLYSALVPNTAGRCATMASILAASPMVVFALQAFWLRPIAPEIGVHILLVVGVYLSIAVAIAVFSSSRIENYRRQVAETRKLGQYVLKEQLGAGGMGEVFRAEHVLLRRPCALKTILPEKAGDPDTLRRFEREVQITATLTHPNTVQVFDYGHAADGTFYYVMEYLPGLTLAEVVRHHGPLPANRAVHFLRQVCAALGEAHARGLTHRDIKPGNVMVCERGGVHDVAKVLDFGLVRVSNDDADGTLTREGTVAGTPAYMSPEQAGGETGIDPRSDIYSVGAVAYFLLTGKPPFAGRSAVKMIAAHLYETPAALPADVPADLAAVVLRCLAKSPAERWPDVAALDAALSAVSVPPWAAGDAAAWWERAARPDRETNPALATASWADPGAAPDPAHM